MKKVYYGYADKNDIKKLFVWSEAVSEEFAELVFDYPVYKNKAQKNDATTINERRIKITIETV